MLNAGVGGGCGRSSAISRVSPGTFVVGWRPPPLEDDIASVAHHLRADLEQLLLQARQRQVLDSAPVLQACGESCQEIVGERMKLEPHGVGPRTCHLIAPLPSLIQLIIRLSKCSWSLHLRLRLSRTPRSAGATLFHARHSPHSYFH